MGDKDEKVPWYLDIDGVRGFSWAFSGKQALTQALARKYGGDNVGLRLNELIETYGKSVYNRVYEICFGEEYRDEEGRRLDEKHNDLAIVADLANAFAANSEVGPEVFFGKACRVMDEFDRQYQMHRKSKFAS